MIPDSSGEVTINDARNAETNEALAGAEVELLQRQVMAR